MIKENEDFIKKLLEGMTRPISSLLVAWIAVFLVLEHSGMEYTSAALVALVIAIVLFFVAKSVEVKKVQEM